MPLDPGLSCIKHLWFVVTRVLSLNVYPSHYFSAQLLASKSGSVINQLDLKGESPLHLASRQGNVQDLEHLLRCGANPNLTASGFYPMHCAVDHDRPEYVAQLGPNICSFNFILHHEFSGIG